MKVSKTLFVLILCFWLVPILSAQRETGSIRGYVTESGGDRLPGVTVTATSPSRQGASSHVTTATGEFRLPALPPGTYTLTAQLQGFKTVKREGIIVHVGMNVEISIQMEASALAEEVTVVASSPIVDVVNSKITQMITRDVIQNLPVARSVWGLAKLAPGVVAPVLSASSGLIAHGSASDQNVFKVDGVSMNDTSYNTPGTAVTYDIMEEIEMITGGLPAEVSTTAGVFVNVVTKSGGNKFSGGGIFYYTNEDLLNITVPQSQLSAMGLAMPSAPIFDYEASANLGGPIFRDKLWFYTNFDLLKSEFHTGFRPITWNGKSYDTFDRPNRQWKGFAKLTGQVAKPLKIQAMFHYTDNYSPYGGGATTYKDATTTSLWRNYVSTVVFQWVFGANTFLHVRGGMYQNHFTGNKQPGTESPDIWAIYDEDLGYSFGTAQMAQYGDRDAYRSSADLSHFVDNLWGGAHEFKAGMELETWKEIYSYWGNSSYPWHYFNGSPYYYRAQNNGQTDPVSGDGWITLIPQPMERDGGKTDAVHGGVQGNMLKFGIYLQDSWTIKNRLTINLGLRYDYFNSWLPPLTFAANPQVIVDIGEEIFKKDPAVAFNPFAEKPFAGWDPVVRWNTFSPRLGITYDLLGDGRTAIKASYSKLTHPLAMTDFFSLHPFFDHYFDVNWWDLNNNGKLDSPPIDKYVPWGASPTEMLTYKELMGDDVKSPYYNEITASIKHELVRDFSVGAAYVYKNAKKLFGAALYDIPSQKFWYSGDQAPQWWIPFTTKVPAYKNYPEQEVIMYFLSNNAPAQTTKTANLDKARHDYSGVEFSFDKRMSNGWQLYGSVTLSKTTGNTEGSAQGPIYSTDFKNPNNLVNKDGGRTANDRPLYIKLYGTFNLPLKFVASFSYLYASGAPFGRNVRVYPPAGWATANNVNRTYSYTVLTEKPGTNRYQAQSQMDFRLEKQFALGKYGKFGVFLDVFNLLGTTFVNLVENPSGSWRPVDANTNVGTYTPSSSYGRINSVNCTRIFKFSLRYDF